MESKHREMHLIYFKKADESWWNRGCSSLQEIKKGLTVSFMGPDVLTNDQTVKTQNNGQSRQNQHSACYPCDSRHNTAVTRGALKSQMGPNKSSNVVQPSAIFSHFLVSGRTDFAPLKLGPVCQLDQKKILLPGAHRVGGAAVNVEKQIISSFC